MYSQTKYKFLNYITPLAYTLRIMFGTCHFLWEHPCMHELYYVHMNIQYFLVSKNAGLPCGLYLDEGHIWSRNEKEKKKNQSKPLGK